jgi:hypothetical protein
MRSPSCDSQQHASASNDNNYSQENIRQPKGAFDKNTIQQHENCIRVIPIGCPFFNVRIKPTRASNSASDTKDDNIMMDNLNIGKGRSSGLCNEKWQEYKIISKPFNQQAIQPAMSSQYQVKQVSK